MIVDLILPCYKIAELDAVRVYEYLKNAKSGLPDTLFFHTIIVFDGVPKEQTKEIQDAFLNLPMDTTFIHQEKNQGKGSAVKLGLTKSKGKFHLFTDADLPYSSQSFQNLIQKLISEEHDIVVGARHSITETDPKQRKMISSIYRWFTKNILRLDIPDTQCGLKGFNHKGREILKNTKLSRYSFDLEFLLRALYSKQMTISSIDVIPKDDLEMTSFSKRVIVKELLNVLTSFYGFSFLVFCLFFSFWLMFGTFGYDTRFDVALVDAKAYSDFGATFPLIRFFSEGQLFPVEYPIYPGEPIRYHYLFFMVVGLLEKIGFRVDYALNLMSIAGFFGLCAILMHLSKRFFKSSAVGVLSILFFLFNGSINFFKFINTNGIDLSKLFNLKDFISFAPWGKGDISAFWTLNIYTNQRHLAFAFALLLFIVAIFQKKWRYSKRNLLKSIGIGILISLFTILHQPSLLIMALFIAWYFIVYKHKRWFFFSVGLTSLIFILLQKPFFLFPENGSEGVGIQFIPGYLLHPKLSILNFFSYWIQNVGIHVFLIPIGLLLSKRKTIIALFPALILFVISNLFQFSKEMAGNHKFINFSFLLGQMFSAYAIVVIWKNIQQSNLKLVFKRILNSILIVFAFIGISGGIVDIFPIHNSHSYHVPGADQKDSVNWFRENVNPHSVVLNSAYMYHPASLAGRKVFMGWPYFPWSAGYDTRKRETIMKQIFKSSDWKFICLQLKKEQIDFATFEPNKEHASFDQRIKSLAPNYLSKNRRLAIYSRKRICQHVLMN